MFDLMKPGSYVLVQLERGVNLLSSIAGKPNGAKGGAFDSAKNHKRQRRKRQSVTAKREKSQTPKFVQVRLGQVRLG